MLTDADMGLVKDTRTAEQIDADERAMLERFRASIPPMTPEMELVLKVAMEWFDPVLHEPPAIQGIGVHQPEPKKPMSLSLRNMLAMRAMRSSARVFDVLSRAATALLTNRRALEWLRVNGCDMQTILKAGIGPMGLARIDSYGNGTFAFSEMGDPALVLPVWENGVMVDLVAWRRRSPKRCWTLLGYADLVGLDAWSRHLNQFGYDAPSLETREPVVIHRTPLAWVQSGGLGIAPITSNGADLRRVLMRAHHICAADPEHGLELRRLLLDTKLSLPLMSVMVRA